MGTFERMKRRKEYLYKKNPYCPLCGVKMFLNLTSKNINRDDLATIDHLNNRYHLKKRHSLQSKKEKEKSLKTRKGRTRLVCKKCNSGIADKETLKRLKEDLWARSGAYPQGHPKHKQRP